MTGAVRTEPWTQNVLFYLVDVWTVRGTMMEQPADRDPAAAVCRVAVLATESGFRRSGGRWLVHLREVQVV